VSGVTWDTCINRYLGGNAPLSALIGNDLYPSSLCLPILWCPADRAPKTDPSGTYTFPWAGARKSYAENGVLFPSPQVFGDNLIGNPVHGVGAYVQASYANSVNLDPPGWKTSIVQDPAGTIQIAEMPTYKSIQGNNWASFCAGPDWNNHQPAGADQYCYQVDSSQPSLDSNFMCYGGDVYRLQGNRFNYLFHDGHVQPLKYTDTIGRIGAEGSNPATTGDPGGMWTVKKGD
jgi:prepilin-type processing-associated H-X9-DG protein